MKRELARRKLKLPQYDLDFSKLRRVSEYSDVEAVKDKAYGLLDPFVRVEISYKPDKKYMVLDPWSEKYTRTIPNIKTRNDEANSRSAAGDGLTKRNTAQAGYRTICCGNDDRRVTMSKRHKTQLK